MNGKYITISWGMGTIVGTKVDKISIKCGDVEISPADVAKFKSSIAGQMEWAFTTDFLITQAAELYELLTVGDEVCITIYGENGAEVLVGYATAQQFDVQFTRGALVKGSFAFLGNGPLDVPLQSITLSPSSIDIPYNGQQQLTATLHPAYATNNQLVWSSSNTNVARVTQNGFVKARMVGTCTITCAWAIDPTVKATTSVNIHAIPVTSITVAPDTLETYVGDEEELVANVLPADAGDTSVTWSSNDHTVAEVDPDDGTVTAIAAGTCTITATANDGSGVTGSCSVVVLATPVPITNITISPSSLSLNSGETASLEAIITPSNATNKLVTWESDDQGIVQVNSTGQTTAVATAIAGGHCGITCRATDGSGCTDTIPVSV